MNLLKASTTSLAALSLGLVAVPASAQTAAERAASAQVLFDDATKLVAAGRFAEACPKFKSAQDLDPGMATQFHLAECYEKLGKFASAWALYVEVADAAKTEKNAKREAVARKRAAAVAPRLSRLTITVPPAVASLEGLTIKRDGIVIDKPLWGMAVPVDPGEHAIAAAAPGKKGWEGAGAAVPEGKTGEVVIPLLEDAPRAAPPLALSNSDGALPPPVQPRSVVPGVVMFGVAAATAGAGVGLLLASQGQESVRQAEADQIRKRFHSCVPTAANYDGSQTCGAVQTSANKVLTFRNVAIGSFVGAGVAAAAGVTYLLWPTAKATPTTGFHVHAVPVISSQDAGLLISGAF